MGGTAPQQVEMALTRARQIIGLEVNLET